MAEQGLHTFILNDETVTNSYGFRTKNSGINLERFKANPVILDSHWNGTGDVIGRWENIKIDGTQLLADAVFDMDDEFAARIAGKVERGFLKGTSMGFSPAEKDTDWNFKKGEDGVPELMSCELMEASICAIPSNRKSLVKLYSKSQVELSADQIKLSLNVNETLLKTNMSVFKLSVAALAAMNLEHADCENSSLVSAAVEKLAANHKQKSEELTTAQTRIKELEAKIAEVENAEVISLVDEAINAGKLNATRRESILAFAKVDPAGAKAMLEDLAPRQNLQTKNPGLGAGEVKTLEDFQKLSHEQQLAFKQTNPEDYKKLFN